MWQAADGAFGMLRDLKSENFERCWEIFHGLHWKS